MKSFARKKAFEMKSIPKASSTLKCCKLAQLSHIAAISFLFQIEIYGEKLLSLKIMREVHSTSPRKKKVWCLFFRAFIGVSSCSRRFDGAKFALAWLWLMIEAKAKEAATSAVISTKANDVSVKINLFWLAIVENIQISHSPIVCFGIFLLSRWLIAAFCCCVVALIELWNVKWPCVIQKRDNRLFIARSTARR